MGKRAKENAKNASIIGVFVLVILLATYVLYRPRYNLYSQKNENVKYADGTYKATGDYSSPGGHDEVFVELTIQNGIVVSVFVEADSDNAISKEKNDEFVASYKNKVIGKELSQLKLDKVSGASLTTNAFNKALEKIKASAQI